jgi:hypothetical protein
MEASQSSSESTRKRRRNDIVATGQARGGRGGDGRGGKNGNHQRSSMKNAARGAGGSRSSHRQQQHQPTNQLSVASWDPVKTWANLGFDSSTVSKNKVVTKTLPWAIPVTHYIPLSDEERLLPTLLHWNKSERGMMKDQPPFRLQKLQKILAQIKKNGNNNNKGTTGSNSMTLIQSLSLRRTHLKYLHPKLTMTQLRLGSQNDIYHSATLFEEVVTNYLILHDVLQFVYTEEDQRNMWKRSGKGKMAASPDFRVKDGHCIQLDFSSSSSRNENSSNNSKNMPTIHWIEVKMFYGASTIPENTPNAVGTILSKMKQYVRLYGTGAIVFMYGCGVSLARKLLDIGVIALDGRMLDLKLVEDYQRCWCADENGNILF